MSEQLAQVLTWPGGDRYRHIIAIVQGLHELATRGRLSFPEEPVTGVVVEYNDASHRYKINGEHVPSVTTILDETEPKPAIAWWAFRVGLAFAIRGLQQGWVSPGQLQAWSWEPVIRPSDHLEHPDVSVNAKGKPKHAIEALALQRDVRHHPNAIKEDAGTKGTSIHLAAEELALTGEIPTISEFPEADRGYVQALARYWIQQEPEVEHQEVIVASKRFGYAGRFDKIVRTPAGQRRMRDYKTSGGVYASFDKQLSLYDLAWQDSGLGTLDGHDVVHLRPDGTYAVVPVTVDHADGLTALLGLVQGRDQKQRIKALGREA